ncbi:MAG: sodium:solute symporter family protein [Phycisphaerales bacterium]
MRMTLIDWLIPAALLATLVAFALRTNRHAKSVAGFLAGNRCAGRYLVCVAYNMAQVGIISLVWFFQQYYDAGYTSIWWGLVENPLMIVIALTGWVAYRYRETRALTLAQFLEMRYSRPFRVFCGFVAFVAGVLNYAIFPAVSARFLIWICGLPPSFTMFGGEIETFPAVMVALLSTAIFFVFIGGQISVMVTDFLQGVFCNITFLVVMLYLLTHFGWDRIGETLLAQPEGRSMLDPLGIGQESQFNAWYWLISAFILFYTMRAWQGDQGYNAAAITPHEAKMATVLSGWRWRVLMLVALVIPICMKVFLSHPDFAADAAPVLGQMAELETDALRAEARVPLALGLVLPAGILGMFVAAMIGAYLSTDDTYLHSWATIFVQDVALPVRALFTDRPLPARTHILLVKGMILAIAVFAFLWGLYYRPNQYVAMWASLTGSVFVAGAGSAIIGGLYWSRGTTRAAWLSMLTGVGVSAFGILAKDGYWAFEWVFGADAVPAWIAEVHSNAWISGQVLTFAAMASAIAVYVGTSLAQRAPRFDLDRLLYRGKYRALLPESERDYRVEHDTNLPQWMRAIGFSREFSRADTWITSATVLWPLVFTIVFVVGTVAAIAAKAADAPISEEAWLVFWEAWTWLVLATGCVIVVWFTVGGVRDLRRMYAHLERYAADARDDGSVGKSGDA